MSILNLFKYFLKFLIIQLLSIGISLWYFDYFLVNKTTTTKYNIYLNLIEDWSRFFNFIPESLITVDLFFSLVIFTFIFFLFSTKFFTYVNELTLTVDKNFLGEFLTIYFLWTSYLFSAFYFLRFEGLSRNLLIIYTFYVPLILFVFRNSEILSLLLGRSPLKENYISINLSAESTFRNLRILKFRKEVHNIKLDIPLNFSEVINNIDKLNKKQKINLVVIKFNQVSKMPLKLESYLINLNKKVILISDKQLIFNKNFIYRYQILENQNIYYFNNDIQYGSKFILKRLIDIVLTFVVLTITFPFFLYIFLKIYFTDGNPVIINQKRVGLHGNVFKMYKFRTMVRQSHEKRDELKHSNKKTGPLFKLVDDPRLLPGSKFLRKYSLDELPQLFNVLQGNMSLVGPRPLFEEDTTFFNKNYMRRLNVLPGMTGLLQINDRNTDNFEIWYKYDLQYIENWNLILDLKILIKTIPSILKRQNSGI